MLPGWLMLLGGLEPPALTLQAGGSWMVGQAPPFWSTSRDRLQAGGTLLWAPDEQVRLGVSVDAWRMDVYPDDQQRGAGDITMTTDVWVWRGPVDLGAGFSVKQPNADDERELGTDEADINLMARLGADAAMVRLELAGGVTFAGDPRKFTTHDRIPELALSAALPTGWGAVRVVSGGGLASATNPARMTASVGVVSACPLRLSVDGVLGLTEAAPDYGVRIAAGWCHD